MPKCTFFRDEEIRKLANHFPVLTSRLVLPGLLALSVVALLHKTRLTLSPPSVLLRSNFPYNHYFEALQPNPPLPRTIVKSPQITTTKTSTLVLPTRNPLQPSPPPSYPVVTNRIPLRISRPIVTGPLLTSKRPPCTNPPQNTAAAPAMRARSHRPPNTA